MTQLTTDLEIMTRDRDEIRDERDWFKRKLSILHESPAAYAEFWCEGRSNYFCRMKSWIPGGRRDPRDEEKEKQEEEVEDGNKTDL